MAMRSVQRTRTSPRTGARSFTARKVFFPRRSPGKKWYTGRYRIVDGMLESRAGNFQLLSGRSMRFMLRSNLERGPMTSRAADGAAEPEIRTGAEHQPAHGAAGVGLFHHQRVAHADIHLTFPPLCAPSRPSRPARSCCRRSGSTSCPRGCPAGTADSHPVAGEVVRVFVALLALSKPAPSACTFCSSRGDTARPCPRARPLIAASMPITTLSDFGAVASSSAGLRQREPRLRQAQLAARCPRRTSRCSPPAG